MKPLSKERIVEIERIEDACQMATTVTGNVVGSVLRELRTERREILAPLLKDARLWLLSNDELEKHQCAKRIETVLRDMGEIE